MSSEPDSGGRKRPGWAAFLTGRPDETTPEAGPEPAHYPDEPPMDEESTHDDLFAGIDDEAPDPGHDAAPRHAATEPRGTRQRAAGAVREAEPERVAVDEYADEYEEYEEYADEAYDEEVYEEADYDDAADWVRYPRRSRAGLRFAILGGVFLLCMLFVRSWVSGWVDGQVTPDGPRGDEIEFTVEPGWPTNRVAEALVSEGVIDNSTVFRYWLRCPGLAKSLVGLDCDGEIEANFRAGEYLMYENMTYADIVEVFEAGPIPEVFIDVNVPEGLRFTQMVDRLVAENPEFDADELWDAYVDDRLDSRFLPEGQPFKWMEGLLFPATYQIDEEHLGDELDILVRMAETMEQRYDGAVADPDLTVAPEIAELGLSEYEVLIIASLIEEEARVAEERPKIARVIYNRLLNDEPLGIDASLLYTADPGADPNSVDHNGSDSPYNLRRVAGLPPTPISAPGEASIRAALAPLDGPWLYYVLADSEGNHAFAETLAEHNANVELCRQAELC